MVIPNNPPAHCRGPPFLFSYLWLAGHSTSDFSFLRVIILTLQIELILGAVQQEQTALIHEDSEALEQAAHRNCGCPIHGNVEGQTRWGFGQRGLVEGVPVH